MQEFRALSLEEIQKAAPQAFAEQPHESTSSRYTFIPTYQVIEDMNTLGWQVCQAITTTSKNSAQQTHGKHMLKFFNPDIFIYDENGGIEAYPQILIINNHRGWGRFKFEIGVFRLVCSNGLVVKDKDMGTFELRHMGYSFEDLKELVNKAVVALPEVVNKINTLSTRQMSPEEQKEFARKALQVRMGEEKVVEDETLYEVLVPSRTQDGGDTLWKVFNRVQEKVIRGGFEMKTEKGKARKVRKITNMLKDVELNQKLWELVEEYA